MESVTAVGKPVISEEIVASKFKWSDLYKNEDWWAIWLGFIVITLGFISVTTEAFTFKGVKVATWGTEANPSVLTVLADGKFIMGVGFTFIVLALLFSIGIKCMGRSPVKFIAGFAGVFLTCLYISSTSNNEELP
ncbi:MAG: hypothetical protein RR817_00820 [Niameybacter sp.]